jgi:hypothetical protein
VFSHSLLIGQVQASKLADGLRSNASTVFAGLIAKTGALTVTNLVDKEEVGHLILHAHFFALDVSLIMSIMKSATGNELYYRYPQHPAEWSPAGLVRCQLSRVSVKVQATCYQALMRAVPVIAHAGVFVIHLVRHISQPKPH